MRKKFLLGAGVIALAILFLRGRGGGTGDGSVPDTSPQGNTVDPSPSNPPAIDPAPISVEYTPLQGNFPHFVISRDKVFLFTENGFREISLDEMEDHLRYLHQEGVRVDLYFEEKSVTNGFRARIDDIVRSAGVTPRESILKGDDWDLEYLHNDG